MNSSSRDHEHSTTSGKGTQTLDALDAEWTEEQFEALVCLHMLKPGQVLTEADCWAIEYTRLKADEVENNAVDAFDNGRKHGILSVVGKTEAAMFEEIGRLKSELVVERALNRYRRHADQQDNARDDDAEEVECPACLGHGFSEEPARTTGHNQHSACRMPCDECDGTGRDPSPTVVSDAVPGRPK